MNRLLRKIQQNIEKALGTKTFKGLSMESDWKDKKTPEMRMVGFRFSGEKIRVSVVLLC